MVALDGKVALVGYNIMLTIEKARELLNYDPLTGEFTWKVRRRSIPADSRAGWTKTDKGYLRVTVLDKHYSLHRLAWFISYGIWPKHQIDHINGNRIDNRLCNLRDVPQNVNCQNKMRAARHNKLGVLGVIADPRGSYRATIEIDGRCKTIGRFATVDEASAAYAEAKRKYHAGCTI